MSVPIEESLKILLLVQASEVLASTLVTLSAY